MEINYEIRTIDNAKGMGGKQPFVSLDLQPSPSNNQIEDWIEQATTLTRADVRAVLTELRHIIEQSLIEGRRFHLNGIGYLSLSASSCINEEEEKKITGKNIFLRGINFLPERELLTAVRRNVTFHRSTMSSRSVIYTEKELWGKVAGYLSTNHYVTVRILREQFALSYYTAEKWLDAFVAEGRLVKEGTRHQPLYFMVR